MFRFQRNIASGRHRCLNSSSLWQKKVHVDLFRTEMEHSKMSKKKIFPSANFASLNLPGINETLLRLAVFVSMELAHNTQTKSCADTGANKGWRKAKQFFRIPSISTVLSEQRKRLKFRLFSERNFRPFPLSFSSLFSSARKYIILFYFFSST